MKLRILRFIIISFFFTIIWHAPIFFLFHVYIFVVWIFILHFLFFILIFFSPFTITSDYILTYIVCIIYEMCRHIRKTIECVLLCLLSSLCHHTRTNLCSNPFITTDWAAHHALLNLTNNLRVLSPYVCCMLVSCIVSLTHC